MLARLAILVVCANPALSATIAAMLRGTGAKSVHAALDGAQALALLAETPFDAVILDPRLVPLDGLDLTRRLRATPGPNRQVPLVLVSGAAEKSFIETARDAGVTEFLRLPVSAEILARRVLSALAAPRPFVEAPAYAGPDRRRRRLDREGPERRGKVSLD